MTLEINLKTCFKWLSVIFFLCFIPFKTLVADGMFCEQSIIFPEIFFIEGAECFSHSVANEIYNNNTHIKKYLERFPKSDYQSGYRYYLYLKEQSFLAAATTLMDMVNKENLPRSITDPFKELNNSLIQGVRNNNRDDESDLSPFRNEVAAPKKVNDLEKEFFSLLTYVASYVSETGGSSKDSMIIYRTYSILLSNIATGIDWEGDSFIHKLFNTLVSVKNESLLEDYISLFFFNSRGDDFNLPSFSNYLKLKNSGAVSFQPKVTGKSHFRRIIAGFFIDNLQKMPEIVITDSLPKKNSTEKTGDCPYLKERGEWITSIPNISEDVSYFNEAVKIVEMCEGSLSFPFLIEKEKIYLLKGYEWLADIAISMRYLVEENISVKDGNIVLNGAVKASIEKAQKSSMEKDFLIYSEKIGKSAEILRAFFVLYLNSDDEKKQTAQINEAAMFLSEILF
jgi:hypothetical protein